MARPSLEKFIYSIVLTYMEELVVMQYNLFDRPGMIFWDSQHLRAKSFLVELRSLQLRITREIDVITLCECFDHKSRQILSEGLQKMGFTYQTHVLGYDESSTYLENDCLTCCKCFHRCLLTNGGVMIVSRHPIVAEREKMFRYDQIYGSDSLSNKGAVYVNIQKGRNFHIFATHLQAWNSPESQSIRLLEMQSLESFMKEISIEDGDGVILSGDLNINRYQEQYPYQKNSSNWEWSSEYQHIRDTGLLRHFAWVNKISQDNIFSYNQKNRVNLDKESISDYTSSPFRQCEQKWIPDNTLVGRDGQNTPYRMEWLDYILYLSLPLNRAKPINSLWKPDSSSFLWCHRLKSLDPIRMNYCCTKSTMDLSDHYPVIACFRWKKNLLGMSI